MFYYKLYGQIIETDMEFIQLFPSDDHNASVRIINGPIPDEIASKENSYEIGDDFSYLSNRTCYLIIKNGNEIIYQIKKGAKESYLRSFILGYGIAMLHQQKGEIAIHCSAMSLNDKAILVAGKSGSGKSTVSSALLNEGLSLMADDMVIVKPGDNNAIAYPAFPFQKLCRDAAIANGEDLSKLIYIDEDKDKFLVPYKGDFDTCGKEVAALFILLGETDTSEVVIDNITGITKIPACADNLFLKALLKEDRFKGKCGQSCVETAGKFPIYVIARPTGIDTVSEIKNAILEKLK